MGGRQFSLALPFVKPDHCLNTHRAHLIAVGAGSAPVPTLYEDCQTSACHLLVIRRHAARRARAKRKAEEVRQHESLALAQESESQYSSQQDRKRKQPCTSITEQKEGQLLSKT